MGISQESDSGRLGLLTVALCGLVAVFEGFDLQAAGVAAPKLVSALGFTTQQLGWFFSSSTLGLMLGAPIGGRLSDRFGRKIALVASVAVFGLLSICSGLADTIPQLLVARFLTGVGLGGAMPNLIALVAENMPVARRGVAVGLLYAGMPCGGASASLVSVIGGAHADWRTIFYVGGIAPLAILPLVMTLLPDSRVTATLRHIAEEQTGSGLLRAAFGDKRSGVTAILWLGFFLYLVVMYLLLSWLPSLLISHGLSRSDAAFVQTAFNVFGAAGAITCGWMMDREHWRNAAAIGTCAAAAATLGAMAIAPASLTIWLAVGAALGASVMGGQAALYGLAPGCYPAAVRGTGVGLAVSVGRFGAVAGPLLASQLLSAGLSATQVLLSLVPAVAVAGIATTLLSLRPVIDN